MSEQDQAQSKYKREDRRGWMSGIWSGGLRRPMFKQREIVRSLIGGICKIICVPFFGRKFGPGPWTHMMEVPQLHGFGPAANRLLEAYKMLLKLSYC